MSRLMRASTSASTTIWCGRSTATRCRRACAPRSAASGSPTACATACRSTMEMAVTDGLTGLHNRRYLERHLRHARPAGDRRARSRCRSSSSTSITSRHQRHLWPRCRRRSAARIFAARAQGGARHRSRLPARVARSSSLAMPDTDAALAMLVGERLRQKIAGEPFRYRRCKAITVTVTVSIGICSLTSARRHAPKN